MMMKAVLVVCGLLAIAAAQTRVKGVEQVARGYDIIFERIRAPLVTYTYDQFGQTWNNPYVNNQLEQIPDQLYITPSPGSMPQLSPNAKIFRLCRRTDQLVQHLVECYQV